MPRPGLLRIEPVLGTGWYRLLWLVPILSIGDVLWAITAKSGVGITFGLGLYKWEMLHVILQVSLIVVLSLVFVMMSPDGEDATVAEAYYEDGAEGERQDEQD